MRFTLRAFALLLFVFSSQSTFSINNDTSKTHPTYPTKFFSEKQFEFSDSVNFIDNSLSDFQNYIPKTTLGNTGLPFNTPVYNPFGANLGFQFSRNSYSTYFFKPDNLKFFDTRTPYTDLFYVLGTKKEQLFKMSFSYNVRKNWNVTANFQRIRSEGSYLRQNTNDNLFAVSTNYKTKNNRYWLLASVCYNVAKNAENGGLVNDSIVKIIGSVDPSLLSVNLSGAKSSNGNRSVFLKQAFNIGRKSTDTANAGYVNPGSRILITTLFEDNYFKYEDTYEDALTGYYNHIYKDSSKIFDSTYWNIVENEIAWKRLDNGKHRGLRDLLGISFSAKHELVYSGQYRTDSTFNNLFAGVQVYNTYSKNAVWWNVSGDYDVNGYNQGDYKASFVIRKLLFDSIFDVSLSAIARKQTVDYSFSNYRTSTFYWKNSFLPQETQGISLNVAVKKYDLNFTAAMNMYSNVPYYDNFAIARQYLGKIPVFYAKLEKNFNFFNWHLNNDVNYQYVQDSMIIRLPAFVLRHSLYYENDILKGAAILQLGASVYYNTEYYANAYMPATGQFYLQDQKKYGNYPFIDVFLCAKIKAVRVFVKVDHLNKGWTGNNYMLTPSYPYATRTIKFGLSWKFYD